MDAVVEGAELIAEEARESILEGGIPSPNHIVSEPGQPPNADTNELDQSIYVEKNVMKVSAKVVASSEAAIPLEFGTSNMEERPFMGPAARKKRPAARKLIVAAVNKVNRGV